MFFIAIGLAMDAFAISLCKGLKENKINIKNALTVASYFGIFQALMPTVGYYLGISFKDAVEKVDHWIAFILLLIIGLSMIINSSKENEVSPNINFKEMILLAIATSIDALAVGISAAFLEIDIYKFILIVGIVTFILTFTSYIIGSKFKITPNKSQILGGIILIIIGFKILLEHLNIL